MTDTKPESPTTYQIGSSIITAYIEALKMLAAGNGAGLFGAGVGLYYFANRDASTLCWIKAAAVLYLLGVCAYAIAAVFMICAASRFYAASATTDIAFQTSRGIGLASFLLWWAGTIAAAIALLQL